MNYMDYGVQLGRRFRALKLWFIMRQLRPRRNRGADPQAHRLRAAAGRSDSRAPRFRDRRAHAFLADLFPLSRFGR